MRRHFVIGAGAIGLWSAATLSPTAPTTLVARGARREALARTPLRVIDRTGATLATRSLDVTELESLPARLGDSTVIVATKCAEVDAVLARIVPRLSPETAVFLGQNGLGLAAQAQARGVPPTQIGRALFWLGARREDDTTLRVAGVHRVDLAGHEALNAAKATLADALRASGVAVDDLGPQTALAEWKKSLWNLAVNALCAIADAPNGAVLDSPPLRRLAERLLDEAIAVASAEGEALSRDDRDAVFASLERTRSNLNATLQDLRHGRATELPWLNAAVVSRGARHGVSTPVNETLVALVEDLERRQTRRANNA
ncbi:MAG: ketopantoate reductase family protein [Myxococcales bacterium]|nr:ketopantoate reductase family protein [Myxococcales bacterium]